MPEQPPEERARNFKEVPLGYSPETAQQEAARCLQCKNPLCVEGCPVNVDIPGFLKLLRDGHFAAAARKIKETNALPAICGRICPQEDQCEAKCILGKKFQPVAVGRCERFVADYERENDLIELPQLPEPNGRKVAIIGAGPASLTTAGDLVLLGYEVVIFEAFHKPGGVLMYGIPEFRLPKEIVEREVEYLQQLGVRLEMNQVIGKTLTIEDLLEEEGYDAVFIGVGAGLPRFLGIPGEDLGGIYSANEYLTRNNLMKAFQFPDYDTPLIRARNVTVVGAGNVAMDAARTALRLGAEKVTIVYRRSREELPAREEEIHHAEEEGIEFQLLTNPVAYLSDSEGKVRALTCRRMELGEADDSGRRRPIPVEGSEFEMETNLVIIAIGTAANPVLLKNTPGIELTEKGYVLTDPQGRTTRERVWAGGDIVTGSATVIEAMGAGRLAAQDMHDYFNAEKKLPWASEIAAT